ncbi:substrate-binding domain-containing protein, partial [Streptomyces litmocidini]
VALVGVDDSAVARLMDPPLTSVRQPIEEMGRTMARMLIQDGAGTPDRPSRVLPTELVVRGSC